LRRGARIGRRICIAGNSAARSRVKGAGLKPDFYRGSGTLGAVEGVEGGNQGGIVVVVTGQVEALGVEGLEEELGDVGEGAGLTAVHAAGGDVREEFAEDEIEGDGVSEVAAEGEEFGGDFLRGLELLEFAIVEEAEFEMGVTEHAATAAVGELEVAARVHGAVCCGA
jgi:hypothetical protein